MVENKLKLSSDEASMLGGLLSAELEVENLKGTEYASTLSKILDKLRMPIITPFVTLTPKELATVKKLLESYVSAFRFETDALLVDAVQEIESVLNRIRRRNQF